MLRAGSRRVLVFFPGSSTGTGTHAVNGRRRSGSVPCGPRSRESRFHTARSLVFIQSSCGAIR